MGRRIAVQTYPKGTVVIGASGISPAPPVSPKVGVQNYSLDLGLFGRFCLILHAAKGGLENGQNPLAMCLATVPGAT